MTEAILINYYYIQLSLISQEKTRPNIHIYISYNGLEKLQAINFIPYFKKYKIIRAFMANHALPIT